jgi:DNA repair protein RecN (Recombination protein N)
MLTYLAIKDFAIVDRLQIEFDGGFNVITGETGAGKSILVNAIHLLLGGRASPDMIRTDKDSAEVEGLFRLDALSSLCKRLADAGLSDQDRLSIRRVISQSGKNRIFVNDRATTVTALTDLTRGLVDISGQHEHIELTDEDKQREILDGFGGLCPLRDEVSEAVGQWKSLEEELRRLLGQEKQRAEREDYLRFSLQRMNEVNPVAGEDEELEKERSRLRHVEKLSGGLGEAFDLLYARENSSVELIGKAKGVLSSLTRFDPDLQAQCDRVEAVLGQLQDLSRDIEGQARRQNADPARLEEVEDRLSRLRALLRTYGPTLSDLVEKRKSMEEELQSQAGLSDRAKNVEQEREKARQFAWMRANVLSEGRKKAANDLGRRFKKELAALSMPGAQFEVQVSTDAVEALNEWGLDRVCFLFSANPGESMRPMSRVASGGELSRILLALKVVLAEVDPVPAYVFDEVDSGVGGAVAEVIGAKLNEISKRHQIFCITHLPQIAAQATTHYSVRKQVRGKRTTSGILKLSDEERVEEVARMASGRNISEETRHHAKTLLAQTKARERSKF